MSKIKLLIPIVAAGALACTFAVQAGARDQSAVASTLAVSTVAAVPAACAAASCERSATAATPSTAEPSNLLLMAAGLGVVGFIASRRRQQF